MIDEPSCPLCAGDAWRPLGRRTFLRAKAAGASPWRRHVLGILFDVWRPGTDEFTVTYLLCLGCGFVLYAPRPTAEEIAAKYRFPGNARITADPGIDAPRERLRTRRIFRILAPYLPGLPHARILDYGGGDGRLVRDFAAAGAECHLVDYNENPAPGIKRVAQTMADLDPALRYDAILCSHVAEHLVDPAAMMRALAGALKDGGTIYVEVPVEIWRRPPTPPEPVTHINFFTPASLAYLVAQSGLQIRSCKLASYPHPRGAWHLVAGCIAVKRPAGKARQPDGVAEVERLLKPGALLRLKHRLLMAPALIERARERLGWKRT